jgi:F subunit of K+-transporting ATPase (Potass_KdpF)
LDVGLGPAVDGREPSLCEEPREAALMTAYIVTGIVALVVTLYLFAALLFPERF